MILVQRLMQIQAEHGFLPDKDLDELSKQTAAPLYRLQELASFFPHFRQEWAPPPFVEIKVCRDMSCQLAKSNELLYGPDGLKEAAQKIPGIIVVDEPGRLVDFSKKQIVELLEERINSLPDGEGRRAERSRLQKLAADEKSSRTDLVKELMKHAVVVEGVSCLGRCDRAPAVCITRHRHASEDNPSSKTLAFHDRLYLGLSANDLRAVVDTIARGDSAPAATPDAGRNIATDEWLIDIYASNPKPQLYAVVKNYLKEHPEPIPYNPPEEPRFPRTASEAMKKEARDKQREDLKNFVPTFHPYLAKLDAANLLGMGGAGLRAFDKWKDVWSADAKVENPDAKYIVCNGDESEPGTFKDRELLLQKPHLVVEGVILAGLMTGATAGFIYIRHEYQEEIEAVNRAIKVAVAEGVCGDNILGLNRSFPVKVFVSPGGYICGEESALIEAMEDRRGQPRNKPPEMQTNGLFDRPTVVNNVETLCWAPAILHEGGKWYADKGLSPCKGRRLFSISGDLKRPGVFEVPIGLTLGELIDLAGGVNGDLKAVATSGPSGGFLPAQLPLAPGLANRVKEQIDRFRDPKGNLSGDGKLVEAFAAKHGLLGDPAPKALDIRALPLDLAFFRSLGTIMGQRDLNLMLGAGLVVYNHERNMLEQARVCTQFYRNESCGKCVPCRIGSQKLVEVSTELVRRRDPRHPVLDDPDGRGPAPPPLFWRNLIGNIDELTRTLNLTSICGLGRVVPNPLFTLLRFFPDDLPAGVLAKPAP
jgi:formate dehydrogenase beta subunit